MTRSAKPVASGAIAVRPSVTVLVPCYNYGRFLNQCIDSVLAQDGVSVRIIIVDDASTDNSAQIATTYAQQDPRVQLISSPQNLGMIPALNLGLQHVDGDYFVKLDADDMLPAGSLKRSVALLESYPNIGFVYGWPRDFTGDVPHCLGYRGSTVGALAEWLVKRGCARFTVWRGLDWLELRYRRARNCIRQPEAVIRWSVLRNVGSYNPRLPHTSDLEMWLRLAAVSDVGRINRLDQGYYRMHPDSMHNTVNAGLLTDLVGRRDAFLSEALASFTQNSKNENLEEIVRRELAVQAVAAASAERVKRRTHSTLMDQLAEFAISTYPAITTLPQWRILEGRWRWWSPAALTSPMIRYCRHEFEYFRWMRTGL
jgi:glycosyltransferase involved in cell wall biosynthesis